jgi:uncharacterized protein YegP (UPF0339 family)
MASAWQEEKKCLFQVWKSDEDGQWYWHLRAKNGEIVADGAEGYSSYDKAVEGIQDVCICCQNAEVEELVPE